MKEIIENFILERKQKWLSDKLKNAGDNPEAVLHAADERFGVSHWIQGASARAQRLHLVSHAPKMTHPFVKEVTSFIAACPQNNDGYVRTGNVICQTDVYGDAAALDCLAFLSLQLPNGLSLLEAFEKKDPDLNLYLTNLGLNFEEIRENFLKIKFSSSQTRTSSLLKQVYFPIGSNEYHLLTIMSPSGMMAELNHRIKDILAKEKECRSQLNDSKECTLDFQSLPDLTIIGYGGAKPQNISQINLAEKGRFFLLPSLPPQVAFKSLRLPTSDFFQQSLNLRAFEYDLKRFRSLKSAPINNIKIREGLENCLHRIINSVIATAEQYQALPAGWSDGRDNLPPYQRIWLDSAFLDQYGEEQWKDTLAEEMARWIIRSIAKLTHKNDFGDDVFNEIRLLILKRKGDF